MFATIAAGIHQCKIFVEPGEALFAYHAAASLPLPGATVVQATGSIGAASLFTEPLVASRALPVLSAFLALDFFADAARPVHYLGMTPVAILFLIDALGRVLLAHNLVHLLVDKFLVATVHPRHYCEVSCSWCLM